MAEINLVTKLVGDIQGNFFIPDYQRGYRWEKAEVETLLNDIYEYGGKNKKTENDNYCLQPIVVRNLGDRFELIDGQQRLTTLYLIYVYMNKASNGFMSEPRFTLSYETRNESVDFLKNPSKAKHNDNIDFFFIYNAYKTIEEWFSQKEKIQSTLTNINKYFDECVKVIWYEVPDTENNIDLFTRLNIGKIPLTSSELVKALFLKDENGDSIRQNELSFEWDNMEKELHNDEFWGFLTNSEADNYPTRIDLVLDLISKKPSGDKETYRTFFYFDDELKNGQSLENIWDEIQHNYLTLKEWFSDHEFYHKIGYLIASNFKKLIDILYDYAGKSKTEFRLYLDESIKESINFKKAYSDLDYEHDYNDIKRFLLLFNVESVRQIDDRKRRFPFGRHKKENWSLEHIHAQHSEGLKTNEKILEWLKAHIKSLQTIGEQENFISDMEQLAKSIEDNPKTTKVRERFEPLQQQVVNALSPKGEGSEYIHLLSNMALLSSEQNSAVSNYTFDAKRNLILEKDKNGSYIPFCTKMVFLKYYSEEDTNLHFWGKNDREAYTKAIEKVLASYLTIQKQENEEG
ncbi:MAG: DUF262 domain-containing protein [Bacteroidales bacterium]|nr:DUF262 domain-containing protein [Bacteroidales bacterium]